MRDEANEKDAWFIFFPRGTCVFFFRYAAYQTWKEKIAMEGGYEKFSRGYERFGFQVEKEGITYREWAPNAVEAFVFGEFSKKHLVKSGHRRI